MGGVSETDERERWRIGGIHYHGGDTQHVMEEEGDITCICTFIFTFSPFLNLVHVHVHYMIILVHSYT